MATAAPETLIVTVTVAVLEAESDTTRKVQTAQTGYRNTSLPVPKVCKPVHVEPLSSLISRCACALAAFVPAALNTKRRFSEPTSPGVAAVYPPAMPGPVVVCASAGTPAEPAASA